MANPSQLPVSHEGLVYSYKQDTLTDIALYIFRFMYRYTVLLHTTCKDELYFCEHNSYKQDTHTDIALYIFRFMYRYTVLLYTTCKLNCTSVNTTHINRAHTNTQTLHFIHYLYHILS